MCVFRFLVCLVCKIASLSPKKKLLLNRLAGIGMKLHAGLMDEVVP